MNPSRPQPSEEPHLLDHLDFLRKRWRMVVAIFAGFVACAALVSLRVDPVYLATARVVVGSGGGQRLLTDGSASIEGYFLERRSFETQLEIIRSEPVAERGARILGRIHDDTIPSIRSAQIASIQAAVSVERVRDTRIVQVRARHPVPEKARDLANAMAEAYIAYAEEQRDAARKRSIAWLSSETANVREALRSSEERLVDYISSEQIDFSGEEESGALAADSTSESLRAHIAAAEVELAQLLLRYRELHPKVQDLKSRLESLRRRVKAEQTDRASSHRKLIQYRILKRDVELDHELYQILLKKLKEADLAGEVREPDIRVLEAARLPRAPIGPHAYRALGVATVLGLCFGLGFAWVAESLDRTLRSPEDVQRELGLPTLAVVQKLPDAGDRSLVAESPGCVAGEVFRSLRTNLRFSHVDLPRRVVLVTSTGPEEGKSTVLSNLAVSLAHSGRRTLVIDTDLRRPSIHRFFRIPSDRGLADLLAGDATPEETILASHVQGLDVLPCGTQAPNPAELIESIRLQELLARLREGYDYVLLDSPPSGGLIDSSLMCSLSDGLLFVVEPGRFDLRVVRAALRQLERAGGRIYGVVLNKAPADDRAGLYGYYRYGPDESPDGDSSLRGVA